MLVIKKSEFDLMLNEDSLIQSDSEYNRINKILEFHKKLYTASYKIDGNLNFFKKNINEYIKTYLPNDSNSSFFMAYSPD